MTITTFIELPVTVEFDCHGASRGARDGFGALTEPPEAPSVEIISVSLVDGHVLNLDAKTMARLEKECEAAANEESQTCT